MAKKRSRRGLKGTESMHKSAKTVASTRFDAYEGFFGSTLDSQHPTKRLACKTALHHLTEAAERLGETEAHEKGGFQMTFEFTSKTVEREKRLDKMRARFERECLK